MTRISPIWHEHWCVVCEETIEYSMRYCPDGAGTDHAHGICLSCYEMGVEMGAIPQGVSMEDVAEYLRNK